MRDADLCAHEIDGYVRKLLWGLQSIELEDRLAISGEIHSHLTDCAAKGPDPLIAAIGRLGTPHQLARRYVEEYELAGAIGRAAPMSLLIHMASRATRNMAALGAVFAVLVLYLLSAALGIIALAKPISPHNVGAWYGSYGLEAGLLLSPPTGGHELLGIWIVPIAVALSLAAYLAGTRLLRDVGNNLLGKRGPALS
ncbi:MAG: hypothetical protein DI623_13175 [Sphingomonas sanxanigenens]|uniref:DUF1700 domain-containing protein n=1 Tax=Sphingomonas sanxanigenens TaxID=397260 RepID=A0A2W5A0T0_9SPHN|nr:MAG: hypothetical protein DI623_13175 [Sphingomonas sanxanigenens]